MHLFRYEHHKKAMASPGVFIGRLAVNVMVVLVMTALALAIGMVGYQQTEGMSWLDAYLNSSMLLGGMGPVTELHTDAGKFFAGSYSLFCGLFIIIASGVVLAPILHRVLHALHANADG